MVKSSYFIIALSNLLCFSINFMASVASARFLRRISMIVKLDMAITYVQHSKKFLKSGNWE